MKKIVFIIALIFISINVSAHNPNTASVIISPINGAWVAQFTISQQGANHALNIYYADKDLSSISITEYKELYIEYLKKKIVLIVDNKEIALSSGGIKLGDHQTDIKFLLPDFPVNYNTVQLKLPMFEENKQQNTVVKFLENNKSFRKILNHKAGFSLNFKNTETDFVENNDNEQNNLMYYLLAFGVIFTGTIVYWNKRKKTVGNKEL